MLLKFFPFFIVVGLALTIPLSMIILSTLLGPRKKNAVKDEPYECGVEPLGAVSRGRLSIKFFITAMIFLVFDVEIAFLFPWAVVFREMGVLGMVEMALFVAILLVGLIYAWKKGALQWE